MRDVHPANDELIALSQAMKIKAMAHTVREHRGSWGLYCCCCKGLHGASGFGEVGPGEPCH
jgi:hypothetical protein